MARHKIRLTNEIRGPDRRVAEPKMGYGEAAGFFGVIIKICLYVFIRMVSYDFDGIFIGADSAVPSQSPELTTNGGRRTGIYKFPDIQRQMGDIVRNPQSKNLFARRFSVAENGINLAGIGIFRTQPVSAGKNGNVAEPGIP